MVTDKCVTVFGNGVKIGQILNKVLQRGGFKITLDESKLIAERIAVSKQGIESSKNHATHLTVGFYVSLLDQIKVFPLPDAFYVWIEANLPGGPLFKYEPNISAVNKMGEMFLRILNENASKGH